jgi:hypothetical protein
MKKLVPLIVLIVLASCDESKNSEKSESDNILENLTYSVDTLVVDSGEELINLSMGLFFSDISETAKTLYQFSQADHGLTVIDLDQLNIRKKIEFEKEGPNGIGAYISEFKVLPDEKFMFTSFQTAGIFDSNSVKLEDIKLKANDYPSIELADGQDINFQLRRSRDGRFLYSLPGDFTAAERDLALINLSANSAKLLDIPALDNTGKFTIIFFSDGMGEISLEEYYLDEYSGKLYLSSSATSDLYRYDFEKDSMDYFSFPITVSPKEKTEFPKKEVSSKAEQREESRKVSSQISFKNLIWDNTRELFFKIGSITTPSDTPGGPANIKVFLYAFDSEMKLVGEALIEGLNSIPEHPFFKDGKLWSYVNVEDELGFAVFTFDF